MSWETPELLWALGALPLVILFSFWRVRPRSVDVGSLRIWKQIRERPIPVRNVRSPRWSSLVLLQMLALAAGVFAMANPRVVQEEPAPVTWMIGVQASPSMGNPAGTGTRLDAAAQAIREIDRLLRNGDRVVLLVGPERIEAATGAEAARALGDLVLTSAPDEGVSVLNEQIDGTARVLCWIGDRRPDRLDDAIPHVLVGASYRNRGIVSTELIQKSDSVILIAGVWTTEPGSVDIRCDVYRGRWMPAPTVRQSVSAEPGRVSFAEFDLPTDSVPYGLRLVLDGDDDFAGDDVRYAVMQGPGTLGVQWVGRLQPDIRKALASLPGVTIRQDDVDPELVIAHREWSQADAARVIVDPPPGRSGSVTVGEASELAAPVRWGESPLLQFLDQDQVPRMNAPRPLAWDGDAPVEALILDANDRVYAMYVDSAPPMLVLGFDPAWEEGRSDWPVRRSFPIFWMNVVARVTGADADGRLRLDSRAQADGSFEVLDGRIDHGLLKDQDGSPVAVDSHAGEPARFVVGTSDRREDVWSVDRPRVDQTTSLRLWMILLAFGLIAGAWALERSSD
jgi:hypothetical protein